MREVLVLESVVLSLLCSLVFIHNCSASDAAVWPTVSEVVSAPFGPRLKKSDSDRYDFHRGIDIAGHLGDDVYAVRDGVVDNVYLDGNSTYPNGGNVVRIKHLDGQQVYYTLYLHLQSISVVKKQSVSMGEVIGTLGHSGDTSFNHLHFEVLEGTTCSLESQIKGGCTLSATGGDPHKNPVSYLYLSNDTAPNYQVLKVSPLTIRVTVSAKELDFNTIRVVDKLGNMRVLDFNLRHGFDATSVVNLDQQTTLGNVTVVPHSFLSANFLDNVDYGIEFIFNDLESYKKIEVVDVWGNRRANDFPLVPVLYQLLSQD